MSLPIRKADKLVVEALRKGPIDPGVIVSIMGSDYVSKMLWWLKKHKFELSLVKDKGKLVSITMIKEGKLPEPKAKVVAPPKEKKTKAEKEKSRKANTFNRMPTKAPVVKKPTGSTPFIPLDDNTIAQGNYSVDADFDSTSMDDIISALRSV